LGTSQAIGWEDRLQSDLLCIECDVVSSNSRLLVLAELVVVVFVVVTALVILKNIATSQYTH